MLPPKLPKEINTDSPLAYFPLTRDNMRHNLENTLRQLHSYGLVHQKQYETLTSSLYAPNAEFHYPIAKLTGREQIVQFWNLFLLVRALERSDVHSMKVDVTWDAEKLQALVQVICWLPREAQLPR
jgi:DNA-binding GntR family transcriptional regulator